MSRYAISEPNPETTKTEDYKMITLCTWYITKKEHEHNPLYKGMKHELETCKGCNGREDATCELYTPTSSVSKFECNYANLCNLCTINCAIKKGIEA
jgi:hypothetical protein